MYAFLKLIENLRNFALFYIIESFMVHRISFNFGYQKTKADMISDLLWVKSQRGKVRSTLTLYPKGAKKRHKKREETDKLKRYVQ